MFAQYKLYILLAVAAIVIGSIGYLKYQNVSLEKDVAQQATVIENLTNDNERLSETIKLKNKTIEDWRLVYEEQTKFRSDLQKELDQKNNTIEKYKARQDVVFAKPGLVQRLEQKALDKFFDEVRNGQ
ncbi:PseT.3 [Vibrio phage nt-1]|uniref:PseT.3 n=1 Tax=Vibrio phage nt-1 TaxID=115992 RepID=R9TEF8_9CAUD|nr:Rz-like spanin [Vibrio phage nt-1]AGN30136.1 PseT.3 [Vibrio phage nt-1]